MLEKNLNIFSPLRNFPPHLFMEKDPLVPRNPMQMVPMAWDQGQEEEQWQKSFLQALLERCWFWETRACFLMESFERICCCISFHQ